MPPLNGVVESALYVADLPRAAEFYTRVLGFPLILSEGDRLRGMAVANKHVLLLFKTGGSVEPTDTPGGRIPPHDGKGTLHLAFAIDRSAVDEWVRHLEAAGVPIESRVDCPGGGHSIYFRDPDQHLVELITPGCWKVY